MVYIGKPCRADIILFIRSVNCGCLTDQSVAAILRILLRLGVGAVVAVLALICIPAVLTLVRIDIVSFAFFRLALLIVAVIRHVRCPLSVFIISETITFMQIIYNIFN